MKSSHNIDKLFADKLSSLESTPSANAWATLEKGLQQKNKKKPLWLPYSVAAAILILILSGILLHNGLQKNGEVISATQPLVKEKHNPPVERISPDKQVSPIEKSVEIQDQVHVDQQAVAEQAIANQKETLAIETTESQKKQGKKRKKAEPIASEKRPEVLPQLPAVQETIAKQQPVSLPEVTPVAIPAEPNTIVVTVQLEEPELEEVEAEENIAPEKQGKAARLFDKLKKLKKGEFDELGIRKEALVAFVKVNSARAIHPNKNRD